MNEEQLASILRAYDQRDHKQLLLVGYNRGFAPLVTRLKTFVAGLVEPFLMLYPVNAGSFRLIIGLMIQSR